MTVRVAVAPGTSAVRIAVIDDDGPPVLLAPWPGRGDRAAQRGPDPTADGRAVGELLAGLLGGPPAELLLVHPPQWSAPTVRSWLHAAAPAAPARPVPTPAAVLAGLGGHRTGVVVLDVGASGAVATRLDERGRIAALTTTGTGGDVLDQALVAALDAPLTPSSAQRWREAAALDPRRWPGPPAAARDVLAAALAPAVAALLGVLDPAPPDRQTVVLVGGVARDPLLAELLDAQLAGRPVDVIVATRPESAAVLGALTELPAAGTPAPPRGLSYALPSPRSPVVTPAVTSTESSTVSPVPPAGSPAVTTGSAPRFLPVPAVPVGAGLRVAAGIGAGVLGAAALLVFGTAWAARAPGPDGGPAGAELVQYGYRLAVPAGWEHTGGRPERRRSVLTPQQTPESSDLIVVELSPLGYDTAAEPRRAAAELRSEFDGALADGAPLSDFTAEATTPTGRVLTTYTERAGAEQIVHWHVVLDGDAQLSVGCRSTPAATNAVRAACDEVVASIRRA